MKKLMVLAASLFLLAGCALFGQNPSLSPEQLKAIAADNKNSVVCMTAPIMGGVTKAVVINIDEARNIDGTVVIEGNCDKMSVNTSTYRPPVVPKPVPTIPTPPALAPQ